MLVILAISALEDVNFGIMDLGISVVVEGAILGAKVFRAVLSKNGVR
jgi:hypothetical protein